MVKRRIFIGLSLIILIGIISLVLIVHAEDGVVERISYSNNMILDSMLYSRPDDFSENTAKGKLKE